MKWLDPSRHDFLNAAPAGLAKVTMQDCARLQLSVHSKIAAGLADWLRARAIPPAMRALLAGFHGDLRAESPPPPLSRWLSRHLGPAIAGALGASAEVLPLLAPYPARCCCAGLARRRTCPGPSPPRWMRAWRTAGLMGADPAGWSWGAIHRLELRHPLPPLRPARGRFRRCRVAGPARPELRRLPAGDLAVTAVPAVRMLIDVGVGCEPLHQHAQPVRFARCGALRRPATGTWAGAPMFRCCIRRRPCGVTRLRIALLPKG